MGRNSVSRPLLKSEVYYELVEMLGVPCTLDAFSPSIVTSSLSAATLPLPVIKYSEDEFFTRDLVPKGWGSGEVLQGRLELGVEGREGVTGKRWFPT